MSERSKLEQVLEFLLAEDNERAEELLHEYVVETARKEYERILDESEVEVEEAKTEEVEEETRPQACLHRCRRCAQQRHHKLAQRCGARRCKSRS